ncbi:unnamed protein product, partial [Hymenolepis diminuta]
GYYFHGSRILTAVIDDLLRQPEFFHADKVVFAGSSAGGIGVMLNIDRLARRLRRGLRYRRGNRPFNRLQVVALVFTTVHQKKEYCEELDCGNREFHVDVEWLKERKTFINAI